MLRTGATEQLKNHCRLKIQSTGRHTSTSIPPWKREERVFSNFFSPIAPLKSFSALRSVLCSGAGAIHARGLSSIPNDRASARKPRRRGENFSAAFFSPREVPAFRALLTRVVV